MSVRALNLTCLEALLVSMPSCIAMCVRECLPTIFLSLCWCALLQRPIVLVSNAAALPPPLASAHLRHLPFQRPAPSAAARVLAGLCAAEGRPLAPAALRALVLRCRCDLRCAGANEASQQPCAWIHSISYSARQLVT